MPDLWVTQDLIQVWQDDTSKYYDDEVINRILYYLQDGPERAFVREELMQVPETTEKPPRLGSGLEISSVFEIYRSFKN